MDPEEIRKKIKQICKKDSRYPPEAYYFVYECLDYTLLKVGKKRHVSGRELVEGIKQYCIKSYGPLAKMVLRCWNITKTADFGEIVFNLVEHGLMSKTEKDTKKDFENVFDFDEEFSFDNVYKEQQK